MIFYVYLDYGVFIPDLYVVQYFAILCARMPRLFDIVAAQEPRRCLLPTATSFSSRS